MLKKLLLSFTYQPTSRDLKYLDGLRGLCALWVFFIHYFPYVHKDLLPFFLGYQKWNAFVPLFFIISGRVNCLGVLKSGNPSKLVQSMIKRPFRLLVPLIIIMLLDLVFKVFPIESVMECFLQPVWFLFCEAPRPRHITWAIWTLQPEINGSYLTYILTFIILSFQDSRSKYVFLVIALIWYQLTHSWMTHFVAGLLFSVASLDGLFERFSTWKHSFIAKCIVGLIAFLISCKFSFLNVVDPLDEVVRSHLFYKGKQGVGNTGYEESWYVFLFSLTVLFLLETTPLLQRIFSWKPFLFLGKISFSLYLVHVYWMFLFGIPFTKLVHGSLPLLVAVPVSATISTLTLIIISYYMMSVLDIPSTMIGNYVLKSLQGRLQRFRTDEMDKLII